jgi:hypothetical protein
LLARLRLAPCRRDFKTVPMILERPDFWDDEVLKEVIAYHGAWKHVWNNTDLAVSVLNPMLRFERAWRRTDASEGLLSGRTICSEEVWRISAVGRRVAILSYPTSPGRIGRGEPCRARRRQQEQALRIDEDVPLLALDLLARVVTPRINRRSPFSALLTLWLSMIAAVGFASREAASRRRAQSASWMRSSVPSQPQRSK